MRFINGNEIFLLEEIVKKNFSSKYKDSVLGLFWSVLKPLFMMAIFTIVFSTLFGRNIENFPVYFLCGWCIFNFFNSAISVSMNSLKGNKNILQRTSAPKHIFVLGAIISEFLNFFITLILLIGVMLVTQATFYWSLMPFLILPIISLFMMVTGLGLMLSVVCVYYSDVQHLWGVLSLMLMYASAIFYPMNIVPEPYYSYLILNPLFWIINQFRCFIYGIMPEWLYIINLLLLSLICLVGGIIIFKRFENKITIKF